MITPALSTADINQPATERNHNLITVDRFCCTIDNWCTPSFSKCRWSLRAASSTKFLHHAGSR